MYFFLLFQFIGLIIVLGGFAAYAKYKEIPIFFFIWHKKRRFLVFETLMFAVIILICIKPIYNNVRCSYNGHSLNKDTKYDWINGQCQIEFGVGKNGKPTYVPYERIRGNSTNNSEDAEE
ncbi:MAG: hypothetical protein ACRCXK_05390 [Wohlfahrtiimonas sp.]